MKLLIVEDELRMAELLRRGLTEEGHAVTCAPDGQAAFELLQQSEFEVVVLDVMMPKLSGYELARRMREEKNSTPVLMLTAKDSVPDIVRGLDLGADDYMTKPFSFRELLLRLGAVQRRALVSQEMKLQVADLLLDRRTREVTRNGQRIFLTKTEYSLLEKLVSRAGRTVPREMLIQSVWGPGHDVGSNTLDAFIRLLRGKLEGNGRRPLIHTVHGVGYVVQAENPA
ncbi:MAG: response regulator transcription factor [Terriglobales bacterium]